MTVASALLKRTFFTLQQITDDISLALRVLFGWYVMLVILLSLQVVDGHVDLKHLVPLIAKDGLTVAGHEVQYGTTYINRTTYYYTSTSSSLAGCLCTRD